MEEITVKVISYLEEIEKNKTRFHSRVKMDCGCVDYIEVCYKHLCFVHSKDEFERKERQVAWEKAVRGQYWYRRFNPNFIFHLSMMIGLGGVFINICL